MEIDEIATDYPSVAVVVVVYSVWAAKSLLPPPLFPFPPGWRGECDE